MKHPRGRLSTLLVVVASLSCGGGGTGPDPGPMNLVLASPNSDDGIVLISISGGQVSGVQASGDELLATPPNVTPVKILIRGNPVAGVVAIVSVPDRHQAASYHAQIVQAAARQTYQQRNVQGYSAALVHP